MRQRWGSIGGRVFRATAVAAVVGLVMALLVASPAGADANDDRADATVVSEPLPFTDSLDASTATGDTTDPGCFAAPGDPANPTVWYSYTPSSDGIVQANTFGSNYDTTLSAYVENGAGLLLQVACNDDAGSLQSRVDMEGVAGETLLFMVGSLGAQPGGDLTFTVDVGQPPLEASMALGSEHFVSPSTGQAVITGALSCSRSADVQVSATVTQGRGGAVVQGFGFAFVSCDGDTQWKMDIEPAAGRFSGGPVEVDLNGYSFDSGTFVALDPVNEEVRLKGSRSEVPLVNVTSDVEYGFVDGAPLLLDVYEPSSGPRRDRPAVVYAHGGGFVGGSKTSSPAVQYATDLAASGVVAVSINYRLNGIGQGIFDAQHDVQAAVRWVRDNARSLGVDADRIHVMGYSAGAIAALFANFSSDDPGDSGTPGVSSEVAGAISLAGFASPALVDPGEPPILMFHGALDTTVPLAWGQAGCDATIAAGNSCEIQMWDDLGHGLERHHDEIVERTLGFMGADG